MHVVPWVKDDRFGKRRAYGVAGDDSLPSEENWTLPKLSTVLGRLLDVGELVATEYDSIMLSRGTWLAPTTDFPPFNCQ